MGPCSMGTWGCSRPVCGAGGRQQEDAGASRAAGINLEIAKNLAWQRAGGQRASLAAGGGMAPLPHGARFPCARPGEVPAICPGSSGSFRSFPVLSGCWGAARQLLGCVCVCVCAQPAWMLISSWGEQNGRRGRSAASRSFWFRDTLTSRNVQTSKGRWRGSCRSPWESSGRRQDPERDDRGGSPGYGAPRIPTACCPLGLSGCLLATLGSPSAFLPGGRVQLQPLASSPAPARWGMHARC